MSVDSGDGSPDSQNKQNPVSWHEKERGFQDCRPEKRLRFALAGNANVGKSVIFNELTGMNQTIGNWPGKTVEKAEGKLRFGKYAISVIDLPGIYSLNTYSMEEIVTRDYITQEKPDVVINVVDAAVLERNLFFTFQLFELERPMVIALNMIDIAEKKGIITDSKALSDEIGVPVVPLVATKGKGLMELVETAVRVAEGKVKSEPEKINYGEHIEKRIKKCEQAISGAGVSYPPRFIALKLLEGDKEMVALLKKKKVDSTMCGQLEKENKRKKEGGNCPLAFTCRKFLRTREITQKCQTIVPTGRISKGDLLDSIALHRFWGYIFLALALLAIFAGLFSFGGAVSGLISDYFAGLEAAYYGLFGTGALAGIFWNGIVQGAIAGIAIAIPYLIPLFIILSLLEDSGYLARVAFLMDGFMHKIGLHGKAIIPILLGYGCSVPGCTACRIMECQRDRFLTAFAVTLVPCSARTVIILGLVGVYMGPLWALGIYLFNVLIVILLGRLAFKALPGEPAELVMEMPSYKLPSLGAIAKKSWFRLKSYAVEALPIIIAATLLIEILNIAGWMMAISGALEPITVGWLLLPSAVGVTLIFGILRKELALVMLASLLGTQNLALALTPVQMITYTLVALFYVPCAATIATLAKEFGWKKAAALSAFEVIFAILLGGVAARVLVGVF